MRAAVLAALALAGCGQLPRGSLPAPSVARAAVATWTAAGYPVGRCREQVGRLRVAVVPDSEIARLCHPEKAAGCLRGHVIVMRQSDEGAWLLAHETVHWLARCSGVCALHSDLRMFHVSASMQGVLAKLYESWPPRSR